MKNKPKAKIIRHADGHLKRPPVPCLTASH